MTSVEREVFAREETRELKERVIEINRVAKVVKGGRRFSFTALVVVGDEKDVVGVGYGKANEVPLAIQKGVERAKKNLFRVPKHGSTITHTVTGEFGSGKVFLKPGEQAEQAGKLLAERAKAAGIEAVVFDRGGYQFHGNVKAFADGIREGGIAV